MTDKISNEATELPHGGTVRDLRLSIARLAHEADAVFPRTLTSGSGPMDAATRELSLMAHGASFHGWALASVLRYIEDTHGTVSAMDAAAIVQFVGADGDSLCEDLYDEILAEAAVPLSAEVTPCEAADYLGSLAAPSATTEEPSRG